MRASELRDIRRRWKRDHSPIGEDIRTLTEEVDRLRRCIADAKADLESGLAETAILYLDEALDLHPTPTKFSVDIILDDDVP